MRQRTEGAPPLPVVIGRGGQKATSCTKPRHALLDAIVAVVNIEADLHGHCGQGKGVHSYEYDRTTHG